MVCLGVKPGAAEWKAQTNPLSYGGTPLLTNFGLEVKIVSLLMITRLCLYFCCTVDKCTVNIVATKFVVRLRCYDY